MQGYISTAWAAWLRSRRAPSLARSSGEIRKVVGCCYSGRGVASAFSQEWTEKQGAHD